MKLLNIGHIENYAHCNKCGTDMQFDKYDLHWTHTEEHCYYLTCPICGGIIWLEETPKLSKMYHDALADYRLKKEQEDEQ